MLLEAFTKENVRDEETDIRESGPLESNDPKSSSVKIETFSSAGLIQKKVNEVQ